MTPPEEALQAAREAYEHLDAAHDLLATARRRWEIRRLQEVVLPVPE